MAISHTEIEATPIPPEQRVRRIATGVAFTCVSEARYSRLMNRVLEGKEQALGQLCRRYNVRRLSLFGSATRADFDPGRSDLDFLVEFDEPPDGRYASQYFGLRRDLGVLFERRVDLVESGAIRNPWFRRGVDASATVLFAT